ncbi:von Willebrand factor C and EGF domain-containing protein-like [Amphiura filiformis]|uniref:von Willebrand factor C and EGF domain-containing protein-like n=1 Tax=Amphiura filiformis TaxID=82378 RepID=UPI003B217EB9
MLCFNFHMADAFRTPRTPILVAFLLLIQLSGYTSNARGNIGIPPLGTSVSTHGTKRPHYIPPRPVWCRYGYYIGCCYGWRRDPSSGQCTPICRNGCVHGTCVAPDRCQCDVGFTGSSCELDNRSLFICLRMNCAPISTIHLIPPPSCITDYNECSRRPCQHRCMNTYGSYRCYCEQGYMLSNNKKNCYRDNRCSRAKCAYGCVQQTRSVRCICPRGWRVDENNHGCIVKATGTEDVTVDMTPCTVLA